MTNVLGDALAAGIIAHVCETDFAPKPPTVGTACLGEQGNAGEGMTAQTQRVRSPKKLFSFLQEDPASSTDKFPSVETSHLHPKENVIEMIEETLFDQTRVHYNICQV